MSMVFCCHLFLRGTLFFMLFQFTLILPLFYALTSFFIFLLCLRHFIYKRDCPSINSVLKSVNPRVSFYIIPSRTELYRSGIIRQFCYPGVEALFLFVLSHPRRLPPMTAWIAAGKIVDYPQNTLSMIPVKTTGALLSISLIEQNIVVKAKVSGNS